MAVVTHVLLRGVTKEQYDKVRDAVAWLDTPPKGGLSHTAWWEGEDCHNLDVWESEDAFSSFGRERLGPGMALVGVASEPVVTFHLAHEAYAPRAVLVVT